MSENLKGKTLRKLMKEKNIVYTIGVGDPFAAKMLNRIDGIDAVLSSGFQIAAMALGMPDVEMYTRSDNVYAVSNMCNVLKKPLIADIDTAYGNAVSAIKTIQDFEKAGVAGVQFEDQISPKRCPICVNTLNTLIPAKEAAGKIKAMVENKLYKDTVIIARTDATDPDELMKRAKMYIDVGADVIQPISKSLKTKEEYKWFVKEINFPVSMIVVGWLDKLTAEDIIEIGPKLCQFALTPINAIYPVLKKAMKYVGANHTNANPPFDVVKHADLISFLGMTDITTLEGKYLVSEDEL